MKFAFLGYHIEKNWTAMSKAEQAAMIDDCFTYDKKLMQEGHVLDAGGALQPSQTAKTVRWQSGAVVVTDGPYAETKEQLGGVGVMQARDMDHAVELMTKHPGLKYGSVFELRPVDDESVQRKSESLAEAHREAAPVDAHAIKFATFGYLNPNAWATFSQEEQNAMLKQCDDLQRSQVRKGQWLSSIYLQDTRSAKTLRAKGGKVAVTDGPYAETKEFLGGMVVLALKDMKEAAAIMSEHPALRFGVVIEIRPLNVAIDEIWQAKVAGSGKK